MKAVIIGLGLRAVHVCTQMKLACPDLNFIAYFDPAVSPQMLELATQHHILPPKRYVNYHDMLTKETYDIVCIFSPNAFHLEHLASALKTDVPFIFVEKPVVTSIEDSMQAARLLHEYEGEKRTAVGLVLRYAPLYRKLLKAQADHYLGDIMSIEACEHIAPYHGAFFKRDWRRSTALSGGFMLEKCCHDIDLYQNLVQSRPQFVASFGGNKKFIQQNNPDVLPNYNKVKASIWNAADSPFTSDSDTIDNQVAIIRFENGVNMNFHTNINVPDEFRRFCVIGTNGMAEGDFIRDYFTLTDVDSGEKRVDDRHDPSQMQNHHYGADEQMAEDIMAYFAGDTTKEKVSITAALEAGITALAIDTARQENRLFQLSDIWAQFDAALGGK